MFDGTSNYSYDRTNQLVEADHSYHNDEEHDYDLTGNRTNDGYQTGANNQLLSDGRVSYSYDAEGNRIARYRLPTNPDPNDPHTTLYTWDHRNRLVAVEFKNDMGVTTKLVHYVYDVYDRRLGKSIDAIAPFDMADATVERYVYDGVHIALVFNGAGSLTNRYLHGRAIDQILADERFDATPGQTEDILWPLVDNLGTIRDLVIHEAGVTSVANHRTFDSFGNLTSETNAAVDHFFAFTGREHDEETGMDHFRARYLDAPVARFISEDPAVDDFNNLSRYVGNNPTNATDPSGMFSEFLGWLITLANGESSRAGELDRQRAANLQRQAATAHPNTFTEALEFRKRQFVASEDLTRDMKMIAQAGIHVNAAGLGGAFLGPSSAARGLAGIRGASTSKAATSLQSFKFRGAARIDSLRAATHADVVKAFEGTGLTPSNHFISRLTSTRTDCLAVRTFKDVETIIRKGSVVNADDGLVAIVHEGVAIILNPKTGVLVTIRPW